MRFQTKGGAWRCRLHGGVSTGPKSAEGTDCRRQRAQSAAANRLARTVLAAYHKSLLFKRK